MKLLNTPEFQNEAEEAEWWDAHPDEALAVLEQAEKDGTLGRGTVARRAAATTSIRLDAADIELAKIIAARRGLSYETYLKTAIHQHLLREADQVSSSS